MEAENAQLLTQPPTFKKWTSFTLGVFKNYISIHNILCFELLLLACFGFSFFKSERTKVFINFQFWGFTFSFRAAFSPVSWKPEDTHLPTSFHISNAIAQKPNREQMEEENKHADAGVSCAPVSVLVLPLFVAPMMAAGGRRGGCLLRLQVLQCWVHVLRVLLAWLVLLILQIRRGVAFCSAACFTWKPQTTARHRKEPTTVNVSTRESTYVFRSSDLGSHRAHILPGNQPKWSATMYYC